MMVSCQCSGRVRKLVRARQLGLWVLRDLLGEGGEREDQQRHQGESKGGRAWDRQGRHHHDPAEDAQAERLASSPCQEAGGIRDAAQAYRGAAFNRRTGMRSYRSTRSVTQSTSETLP